MSPSHQVIGASVVAYHPDRDQLRRLVSRLTEQVDHLVVVDNGGLEGWSHGGVTVASPGQNLGVAGGHNLAVEHLRHQGCTHLVLFDQDSLPEAGMIAELLAVLHLNPGAACVGPRYHDPRFPNLNPFVRFSGLGRQCPDCSGGQRFVAVSYVITSGCLIPLSVWDRVGPLRQALFIDYVDVEWGMRAQALGYRSVGACKAGMLHTLGEKWIAWGGRKVVVHSAERAYYQVRNRVWMYVHSPTPMNWKLIDGIRLLMRMLFSVAWLPDRFIRARLMWRGLTHGVRGRLGPLSEQST